MLPGPVVHLFAKFFDLKREIKNFIEQMAHCIEGESCRHGYVMGG